MYYVKEKWSFIELWFIFNYQNILEYLSGNTKTKGPLFCSIWEAQLDWNWMDYNQPIIHRQNRQFGWCTVYRYRHMWSVCSQAHASRPRVCRSLNPANFHPEQILNSNFLLPLYCPQPYLNVGELRKYNYIWKLKTTWDLLLYFLFSILFFITPRNYLFYITCFIRFISRIRIYLFKFQSYLQNLWIQEVVFFYSKWAKPK